MKLCKLEISNHERVTLYNGDRVLITSSPCKGVPNCRGSTGEVQNYVDDKLLKVIFQKPVYSLCFVTCRFNHAFCRSACRRCKHYLCLKRGEYLYDGVDDSGLASAWSSCNYHNLASSNTSDSFYLSFCQFYGKLLQPQLPTPSCRIP